jgi:hypothetical protein
MNTLTARIVGPVRYQSANGEDLRIPLGPCLIERLDDESVDIIWGTHGQISAAVPAQEVMDARKSGRLVLLD